MAMHPVTKSIVFFLASLGIQQFVQARLRRSRALHQQKGEAVAAWEGEGGAVPVSDHRIAASVRPAGEVSRSDP